MDARKPKDRVSEDTERSLQKAVKFRPAQTEISDTYVEGTLCVPVKQISGIQFEPEAVNRTAVVESGQADQRNIYFLPSAAPYASVKFS